MPPVHRALALLAALALAVAPRPLGAQQALVGISPSGVAAPRSGQAVVPIVADLTAAGGATLGSYRLQLTWDPAVIKYVSSAGGAFGSSAINAAGAASGTLELAGANAAGAGGVTTLATVTFEMVADTGSSLVSVGGLELTAAQTFAALTPMAIPGRMCANTGLYGDLDRNGSLLGNDALALVTVAVGLPLPAPFTLLNGDVDANGTNDTRDALLVLSAAVGLPTASYRVGTSNTGLCAVVPAASLAVAPATNDLAQGDRLPLEARALSAGGQVVAPPGLAWTTTDPAVATVDTAGTVTAVGNGTATIRAQALGGLSATAAITVATRHVWFVEQAVAAANPVQHGSPAFPFATIQQGIDAAAPGDTVRVGNSPPYGPVTIARAVVLLGDSGVTGMPTILNSTGPAIVSNAPGTVVIRRFNLIQSNGGLDARGDSLDIQSIVARSHRGPGFRVRNMRYASLVGVSGSELQLAGVFIDSTPVVKINGATFQVIEPRGDSAVGVAVVGGDSAALTAITVIGIAGDGGGGAGVNADSVGRVTLSTFDVRQNRGVKITRARYVSLTNGSGRDLEGDPALNISADTVVIAGVQLRNIGEGALIRQRDPLTRTLQSVVTVTNSTIDSVLFSDGLRFQGITRIIVDATTIAHVTQGVGLFVDSTALLSVRGGRMRAAFKGAIFADAVDTVSLVGVEVDSSASPDPFFLGCSARLAVSVSHADSVRLDSLNVHDNAGGGILVDSARVVTGTGTKVVRNLGQRGFCDIIKKGTPPAGLLPTHTPYQTGNAPGAAFAGVQITRLSRFTVDSNTNNGLEFDFSQFTGTAVVDTTFFRGGVSLVHAFGSFSAPSGVLTVRGGAFHNALRGVLAEYLSGLVVQATRFDSTARTGFFGNAIQAYTIDNVQLFADTVENSDGDGIWLFLSDTVHVDNVVARGQSGGAALHLQSIVDSGAVLAGRFESNTADAIRVDGTAGRVMVIDGNVMADGTTSGLVLAGPATVKRNLLTRNKIGLHILPGGDLSAIDSNNVEGNVVAGLLNVSLKPVTAINNWWNNSSGPLCRTGCPAAGTPLADSVLADTLSGSTVTFAPFLTARPPGAPTAVAPLRPSPRATAPLRREERE